MPDPLFLTVRWSWCRTRGSFCYRAEEHHTLPPGRLYMGQTQEEAERSLAELNARRQAMGLPAFRALWM